MISSSTNPWQRSQSGSPQVEDEEPPAPAPLSLRLLAAVACSIACRSSSSSEWTGARETTPRRLIPGGERGRGTRAPLAPRPAGGGDRRRRCLQDMVGDRAVVEAGASLLHLSQETSVLVPPSGEEPGLLALEGEDPVHDLLPQRDLLLPGHPHTPPHTAKQLRP